MARRGRPRWRAALEAVAVALLALLLGTLLVRLAPLLQRERAAWLALSAGLAGMLAADAGSGLVHWLGDSFFEEDSLLIGPVFIRPFREHHADPRAMTRHGFLELNGNSAMLLAPVLALALGLWPTDAGTAHLVAGAFLAAFSIAAFATNQLHCWAHLGEPPAPIRWLQRRGAILSGPAHARHHAPPHDRAYCVTTGWLNGPLDRSGFFRGAERALGSLGLPAAGTRLSARAGSPRS